MSENLDGVVAVIPSQDRYLESVKNVEERLGVTQFPDRLLRFRRKVSTSAGMAGTRLKLAKTESQILPNGGTGPVRCYSGRSPVGTPLSADAGQLIAELLWMDNDEAISQDIEVLLAFFPDLKTETAELAGAFYDSGNSDEASIANVTTNACFDTWKWRAEIKRVTGNTTYTILKYDPVVSSDTSGLSFGWRFEELSPTLASLRVFLGGSTVGVTATTFTVSTYWLDYTDYHEYLLEWDGATKLKLTIDGTLIAENTVSAANFDGGDIVLGRDSGSTQYLHGFVRNMRFDDLDDSTQTCILPHNQTGTATTLPDLSGNGNDATFSSGDISAVWAANSGVGKSGWLIIGADCEAVADTSGAAP